MSQPVNQINELIYRQKCQTFTIATGYKFLKDLAPGTLISDTDYVATGIANKQVIRYLTKLGTRYVWFSAGIHPTTGLVENGYVEVNKKRSISKKTGKTNTPMRLSENMIWGQPNKIIQEIQGDAKKRSALRYWIQWCILARETDDLPTNAGGITNLDIHRLRVYMHTHYPTIVTNLLKPKTKKKKPAMV